MSGDEIFVLLLAWIGSGIGWWRWYRPLLALRRFGVRTPARQIVLATPPLCLAVLALILGSFAASDVREAPQYLAMYLGLGSLWIVSLQSLTLWFGVGARDDVAERNNPAAAAVVAGALLALSLCYAGGNIGEGPGWWVVAFSAAVATAGLFAVWLIVETLSGVSEAVTVERDVSSGLRLAGLLVASGLVLGRSVAGNWESAEATLRDVASGSWPVLVLAATEIVLGGALRRIARHKPMTGGVLPAALYVGAAAYTVVGRGWW